MERCPTEVLDLIFAEACTDDGYTGRSLALVSQRIRAISSRHALNSIALCGYHQITAFGTLLEGRKDEDRSVRHLYLTDRPGLWMKLTPDKDKRVRPMVGRLQDVCYDRESDVHSAVPISRILRIVAPHLRTLTYLIFADSYVHSDTHPLPMVPFPRLEELTLHELSLSSTGPSPMLPSVPTLRRLHIIQRYSLPRCIVQAIAHLAPHLTHLRLSRMIGSHHSCRYFLEGLERMLEDLNASEAPEPTRPCLPSSLQRVIVQLSQQALYDSRGTLRLFTSPVAYQLRNIACRDARKRIVMVRPYLWTPTSSYSLYTGEDIEFYTSVKASWLSRILGEEGVWRVDPVEILATHGLEEEPTPE
ncbi:hypothetical protein OH77DRAFT_1587923 [Trametes cingulata]|nr:hypothetical protein OH77DRAFT_1587923 [Trametes cingulata]